ncbi:MAG: transcriptional regulator [Planctomycetes bacterium]|nr:transcriptional regulator [Planctomycetota bacterium]NOG55215.1 transcriptional regulator [Planctomycetota bacterium]
MNDADLPQVVAHIRSLPHETEWVEFKVNNCDAERIGKNISAIANAAVLQDQDAGYIVWGIENKSHQLVGTDFRPKSDRRGSQPLEIWLASFLSPRVHFTIHEGEVEGKHVVVFCVPAASQSPVAFKRVEYVRIGESTTELRQHIAKEREMWSRFDARPFETLSARERLDEADILPLLDFPAYFELIGQPLPENRGSILERLTAERLVEHKPSGYAVTNLGATLFAKSLSQFERLARKAVRVVVYRGDDRTEIVRQQEGDKGYAAGFSGLVAWLNAQLPQNEPIGQALRTTVPMYPEIAVREVVANALIHQDFTVTGTGPLVEVFRNRVEVSNPGRPIIDPNRLDIPPRSRNEQLASLMRRMGMCEELGSGIDRVLTAVEFFQLPPPAFIESSNSTRVTLFAYRRFAQMDREERIRACYQHAGLRWITGERMSNSTLRRRFGIEERNYAQVSRVIADTVKAGMIRPDPPDSKARRHAKYAPFWAAW